MKSYLDCWTRVAADLFSQALAGEPALVESVPKPMETAGFGWTATLAGEEHGRFTVVLDGAVLKAPLFGDGADQKSGWCELLRETFDAAAGELLAASGRKCRVEKVEEGVGESHVSRAYQLEAGERSWTILVREELQAAAIDVEQKTDAAVGAQEDPRPVRALSPGLELLLDVELDASLRFGCREMSLGEILELGPGDVVPLDRQVSDAVDLVVGDKIVARGEVVLVNGNFGLRVSEVAAPKKRLESIRCLF